jgi:hypothetical protein
MTPQGGGSNDDVYAFASSKRSEAEGSLWDGSWINQGGCGTSNDAQFMFFGMCFFFFRF